MTWAVGAFIGFVAPRAIAPWATSARFGTSDPVPDGFVRQLRYPLWRAPGAP